MNLYRWLNKRHQNKISKSIHKQIEKLEAGTLKTYSWEDMEARMEARELDPWYKKWYRHVRYSLFGMEGLISYTLNPRIIVNKIVWDRQRAKRGWCDSDCWSIDGYITRVLSQMLDYLSVHNQAYPGQPPWETPELWEAHLRDLSARMGAWSNDTFADDAAYQTTKAAMEEFARNLGHYWD
jgi:hypothetical protein